MSQSSNLPRLLPYEEVESITGIGRVEICRRIVAGTFPRPVKLGRRSLFDSRAITAWVEAQIAGRESAYRGGQ